MARRLRERAHAAGGTHDERLGEPCLAAPVGQRPEVLGEHRAQVCVDRGRGGALVLPELGRDLVGGDDVRVRQPPADLVRDEALVRRVPEGEEEADRHGLRVELRERVEIEWLDHALWADALVDADAALERDERLGVAVAQAVEVRARLATQVEHVLEPGRADERGARALALEQRVGGDRGPVREALQVHPGRADLGGGFHHRVLLRADGRDLGSAELAVRQQHGVRERASDVDPEDRHAARLAGATGRYAAWRRRYERAFVRLPHTAIEHQRREWLRAWS